MKPLKISLCGFPLSGKRTLALSLLRANGRPPEVAKKVRVTDREVVYYKLDDDVELCLCSGSIFFLPEVTRKVMENSELVILVDKDIVEMDEFIVEPRVDYLNVFKNIRDEFETPWIYVKNSCEGSGIFVCDSLVPSDVTSFVVNVKIGNILPILEKIKAV